MPDPQPDLYIAPLGRQHDREAFTCGVEILDRYLKTQARQDVRRRANAVFVLARGSEPRRILGYHTLCAFTLAQGEVPEEARKRIPRYPLVSATLIGRLAVASNAQGQGHGAFLLVHALRKAYENAGVIGSCMVVVDAIDENAVRFYEAHGLIRLPDSMRLVIPMTSIAQLLE
jgi:GNAT superfamily N-acetyltransferase